MIRQPGYDKRTKDPPLGLVEDFYCVDGHMEINGHTFTSDNIARKK